MLVELTVAFVRTLSITVVEAVVMVGAVELAVLEEEVVEGAGAVVVAGALASSKVVWLEVKVGPCTEVVEVKVGPCTHAPSVLAKSPFLIWTQYIWPVA